MLRETYEQISAAISRCNAELLSAIAQVETQVRACTRRLKAAYKILNPLGTDYSPIQDDGWATTNRSLVQACTPTSVDQKSTGLNAAVPTGAGAVAGGAVAVSSWGGVQALAHASTGTAMMGLHGAAASSAGWAWFGGGGMAAGHLVLPGIGTAVAIAVSATLSYREANKVAKLCDELGDANNKNEVELKKVQTNVKDVDRLSIRLNEEQGKLDNAIWTARNKVRPFGWFSHLRRLLRYWIWGYYYTQDEFKFVQQLDAAYLRFIEAFKSI
jgi:hypothetical protein